MAYDAAKGEVFVANSGGPPSYAGSVSVINDTTDTVVATIPVGHNAEGTVYDAARGQVFVVNDGSNNVSVISDVTDTVVATVPVGSYPDAVAYDPAKGEVFVTNSGTAPSNAGSVSVINDTTDTVVATIPVGSYPVGASGVAYDAAKGEVFVPNSNSNNVSVISDATNTVVTSVPVGTNPRGSIYDVAKGQVFVTNSGTNNVSVISDATDTVVATVPVGHDAQGAAYDAATGEVFVPNFNSNNVSVISDATDTVVATVPVGTQPLAAAYDAAKGEVFVTNYGSDNVSAISFRTTQSVPVVFDEWGLPVGTSWSITLNGALQASTSTTIFFYEWTGSYSYTVGAIAGYSVRPASGAIVVRDTLVGQAVLFTRLVVATYPVVFAESGLSAGTTWSVTLGGATLSSNNPSIVFYETNGSYPFSVGPVSGYSVLPGSGTATIGGSPVVMVLAFTAPSSPATGFLGLPPTTGSYVSGGILGIVGFLVGAMFVQFWKRRPTLPDATEQSTEGQPPSPAETVGRGSTQGNGGSTRPPRAPGV